LLALTAQLVPCHTSALPRVRTGRNKQISSGDIPVTSRSPGHPFLGVAYAKSSNPATVREGVRREGSSPPALGCGETKKGRPRMKACLSVSVSFEDRTEGLGHGRAPAVSASRARR